MQKSINNKGYFPIQKEHAESIIVKRKNSKEEKSNQKSTNAIVFLLDRVVKLTRFILNNPLQTLTLALAGQVMGSNALRAKKLSFSDAEHSVVTNSTALDNLYFNDRLINLEQKVLPAINSLSLNRTTPQLLVKRNSRYVNKRLPRLKRQASPPDAQEDMLDQVDNIKDELNSLQRKVNRLMKEREDSSILDIKRELEDQLKAIKLRFDNVKTDISQNTFTRITQVADNIHRLQRKISELENLFALLNTRFSSLSGGFYSLKSSYEKVDRYTYFMKSCIAAIKDGNMNSAKNEWNHLVQLETNGVWSQKSLENIIIAAYDGRLSHFDKLEDFISYRLDTIPESILAYTVLFNEMKRAGHEDTSEVLKLLYFIQVHMEMTNYPNIPQEFKEKAISLKARLVEAMYGNNLSNAEKVLQRGRDLPSFQQTGVVYEALWQAMNRNNHLDSYQLLMLAYRIKEHMDMSNYQNLSQKDKDRFEILKNRLPSGVRALLWDSYIYVGSNRYDNYYLYDQLEPDGSVTYTCNKDTDDAGYKWYVKPKNNGRYFSFHPQTSDNNAIWLGGSNSWQVNPINSGSSFFFKNRNNRILDSGNKIDINPFERFLITMGGGFAGPQGCSTVHAYPEYTGTNYQHWKIR